MQSADLAIRLQRAAFNRALAECDLDAIGALLAKDVVLVTGTDSAVLSGRRAQLLAWKREFAAADRTLYSRVPEAVEASSHEPLAMERGRWEGVSQSGGKVAQGTYAAKWRRAGDTWIIEAEIFVTLA